ncbi:hypothetical protein L1887_11235 [Cichorium endivia]|nr:hypothetical protein L1887_11235 [Cichorium endivia]
MHCEHQREMLKWSLWELEKWKIPGFSCYKPSYAQNRWRFLIPIPLLPSFSPHVLIHGLQDQRPTISKSVVSHVPLTPDPSIFNLPPL